VPYEITYQNVPAGYAVGHHRGGEKAAVQYLEFTSSEDGQHFIQRLEGFPDEILRKLAAQQVTVRPSEVDHILAIFRRDKTATVYLNEVPQVLGIRISKPIKKGDAVYKDDIVDIANFDLGEITIPDDCGVLFLFSLGWRKGLFYDFGPIVGECTPRNYGCEKLFGQYHSHVYFQERFAIPDGVWDALFESQWFPFSALKHSTVESLINHARAGWDIDDLLDQVVAEVNAKCDTLLAAWEGHKVFSQHIDVLKKAVEHFRNEDYLSCTGLLYPRIEGILRSNLAETTRDKPNQSNLSAGAVSAKTQDPKSLLLPHKFEHYLKEVYFANFNPNDEDIKVSRHSVSHGTASSANFNEKAAVLGILTVHHLFYCFEPASRVETAAETPPGADSTDMDIS